MDIILVTAVCYTANTPFTYTNVRSVFTPSQRYNQLQKTLFSVREVFPSAIIVLAECSMFSNDEEQYLKSKCDVFLNLIDDEKVREDTSSIYKGLGERILTLKALEYILANFKVHSLFKITGRYYYNEKLNLQEYNNDKMNFYCIDGNIHNVNTCGYKINGANIANFTNYLSTTRQNVIDVYKGSYEQYISAFVNQSTDVQFVKNLGISGQVSVCGSHYSQ